METGNSKIEIISTSEERARVNFLDNSNKSRYNFVAEVENGTLSVSIRWKPLQFFNIGFKLKPVVTKVYLPEKTYASILAKTENGGITVGN